MRRRIRAAALAAALLSAALVVTACGGRETENSSTTEPTNRYDWTESSQASTSRNTNLYLTVNEVNGEQLPGDNVATYEGGEVSVRVTFTQSGVAEADAGLLVFLDGIPQEIQVGEEPAGLLHRFTLGRSAQEKTFRFTPGTVRPGERVNLVVVGLLGYTLPSSSSLDALNPSRPVGAALVGLLADGSLEAKTEREFTPTAPAFSGGEYYAGYLGGDEALHGDPSYDYVTYDPGNLPEWYLPLAAEPGRYRTVLLLDGEPAPAFGGEYVLDWESGQSGDGYVFPLDLSFLPDQGTHNLQAITVNMAEEPMAFDEAYSNQITTVEAAEGAGS